jgi:predicted PurR-regulated permease PerM
MMLPYFILAIAVIVSFRIINEAEVIFGFFARLWFIIRPFFYGFLLAYCLSIPAGGMERLFGKVRLKFFSKRKKALSIVFIYILFLLSVYFIFAAVVPYFVNSVVYFIANINTYYEYFQQLISYINELDIVEISLTLDDVLALIPAFSLENLNAPLNVLFGAASALFTAFLTFVSSIYILFEKERFKVFMCRLLRAFTSSFTFDTLLKYARRLNENFKQYIYTQTLDGIILGTIATLELRFIIGTEYFLVLGIMLGIINYIPYFGSIIGSAIAVFVVMITMGFGPGLLTAVILLITQQIDGNIIQPRLMGGRFAMSPLLVIISITIGGAFAGMLGMIAAIPIVAVLKDIAENVILYYEHKKKAGADIGYGE